MIQFDSSNIQANNNNKSDLPWVQKYRPSALQDLISHEYIINTLQKFMRTENLPNLLFYGPPGTGKTSTIKALAREFYQKDYNKMVLEFNASDDRGIETVRSEIKNFASNKALSQNNKLKLIILDEADMMTPPSQFALRRIIQKYSSNARFCLISNYVTKIIPALQSRCTRFKFKQIPFTSACSRIQQICNHQRLSLTDKAFGAVFKLGEGDMRRMVNMLQSLSLLTNLDVIDEQDIYNFTGNPSPKDLSSYFDILLKDNLNEAYRKLELIFKQNGISMLSMVKQIYDRVLFNGFSANQLRLIIPVLADIEHRVSIGGSQKLALGALVGIFSQVQQLAPDE